MNYSISLVLAVFILFSGISLYFFWVFSKLRKRKYSLVTAASGNVSIDEEQLKDIACQLDNLMGKHKLYTNPDLSIVELANMVGTNRTYLSSCINVCFNQNFCSYINGFRKEEARRVLMHNEKITHKELAMASGFGSVDTMKRVIRQKAGMTFNDWKLSVHNECQNLNLRF